MSYSSKVLSEIRKSIEECENHTSIEGSLELHDCLISKFTVIDPSFEKGLPRSAKTATMDSEPDYRPEINAIKDKLKMMLLCSSNSEACSKTNKIPDELQELISDGENILGLEYYYGDDPVFDPDRIDGPVYDLWALNVETYSERYLKSHPLYKKITVNNEESQKGDPQSVLNIINCLISISRDQVFLAELDTQQGSFINIGSKTITKVEIKEKFSNKVFLVHGHDNEMKQDVARFLEKAKLNAIILHEQPNEGMTIIEKFEKHTDVAFAIVLYSPCDLGRSKKAKPEDEKPRARQNVVFEHGYLNGRLGRDKVCALLKDDVEKPSDIDGVLYIPMDDRGAWKSEVAREMKKAGLDFTLEALL